MISKPLRGDWIDGHLLSDGFAAHVNCKTVGERAKRRLRRGHVATIWQLHLHHHELIDFNVAWAIACRGETHHGHGAIVLNSVWLSDIQ